MNPGPATTPNRKRAPTLLNYAHAFDPRTRYLRAYELRRCPNVECPEALSWRERCRRCDTPTVPLSGVPPCNAAA